MHRRVAIVLIALASAWALAKRALARSRSAPVRVEEEPPPVRPAAVTARRERTEEPSREGAERWLPSGLSVSSHEQTTDHQRPTDWLPGKQEPTQLPRAGRS